MIRKWKKIRRRQINRTEENNKSAEGEKLKIMKINFDGGINVEENKKKISDRKNYSISSIIKKYV